MALMYLKPEQKNQDIMIQAVTQNIQALALHMLIHNSKQSGKILLLLLMSMGIK